MNSAGRLWPPAELRAGDADRQRVVAELQRHFIEGRLTSEELGERVDQALKARTFGELAVPLADLPPLGGSFGTPSAAPSQVWQHWLLGPRLGVLLILVGVVALLAMIMFTQGAHVAVVPFWPILIWGFFFFGRPYRGGGGRRNR